MEEEKIETKEHTEESKQDKKKKINKPTMIGIIILIALGVGYFIHQAILYQSTDDAYVETTTVSVAPRVSGQIVEVMITDNQAVEEGDEIAKIDDTDYKVALDSAKARYERILLDQENAKANYNAMQSAIDSAKADLDRYKNLYAAGAVSKQALDNAQTKYDSAVANLTNADQALLSKDNNKVADADLKAAKAAMEQAELNLSYTTIKAPQAGTIASRRVERGMYVNVGSPLCTIVPHNVWVVANFKENQLRHMKPGQPVDIKVDTYPNKIFKGEIDSIQRSSGAKASLFPPENAVGSFVKIVQRVPVKIVFTEEIDPNEYNIVPGMSVVPKVRVR